MFKEISEIDGFLIGGASKSSKKFIIQKITIDNLYGKFTNSYQHWTCSNTSNFSFAPKSEGAH